MVSVERQQKVGAAAAAGLVAQCASDLQMVTDASVFCVWGFGGGRRRGFGKGGEEGCYVWLWMCFGSK
jgi:hypothetical protein